METYSTCAKSTPINQREYKVKHTFKPRRVIETLSSTHGLCIDKMVLLFDVGTSGITTIINISIYSNAMYESSILTNSLYHLDKMLGFQACIPEGYPAFHDVVIKWKHFPRYWPFVHKGQWHGSLMFSLICVWINDWVNNRDAGDLRRHRVSLWRHCNVNMFLLYCTFPAIFFEFMSCNVF